VSPWRSQPSGRVVPTPAGPFDDDEETITVDVNELLAEAAEALPFQEHAAASSPTPETAGYDDLFGETIAETRAPVPGESLPFSRASPDPIDDPPTEQQAPDSYQGGTQLHDLSALERERDATPFESSKDGKRDPDKNKR
jgi:hypothetical protein